MIKIISKQVPYHYDQCGEQSYEVKMAITVEEAATTPQAVEAYARILLTNEYTRTSIINALRQVADELENGEIF